MKIRPFGLKLEAFSHVSLCHQKKPVKQLTPLMSADHSESSKLNNSQMDMNYLTYCSCLTLTQEEILGVILH